MAISSTTAIEREEKWKSLVNHIANVHVHKENKFFTKCAHAEVERDWIKQGTVHSIHCSLSKPICE